MKAFAVALVAAALGWCSIQAVPMGRVEVEAGGEQPPPAPVEPEPVADVESDAVAEDPIDPAVVESEKEAVDDAPQPVPDDGQADTQAGGAQPENQSEEPEEEPDEESESSTPPAETMAPGEDDDDDDDDDDDEAESEADPEEEARLYADQEVDVEGQGSEQEQEAKAKDVKKEYRRYLAEKRRELERNPKLRAETIAALEKAEAAGGEIPDEERVLLEVARKMQQQEEARSLLEEQQRELIDAQRRTAAKAALEAAGVEARADEFNFRDADREVWLAEKVDHKKLIEIAKRRVDASANLDRDRRRTFMQHEMRRLLSFRKKIELETDPAKKEELLAAHEKETEALAEARAARPGSKEELAEIYEKDDGFDKASFDPKTFFRLHDINGDGVLDNKEMEAMFIKEATRMHARRSARKRRAGGADTTDDELTPPEDKFVVSEETARMREHVMKNFDENGDGMLSEDEWKKMTGNKKEFERKKKDWKPVNPEAEITDKQMDNFKKLQAKIANTKHGEVDPNLLRAARRFKDNLKGIPKMEKGLRTGGSGMGKAARWKRKQEKIKQKKARRKRRWERMHKGMKKSMGGGGWGKKKKKVEEDA